MGEALIQQGSVSNHILGSLPAEEFRWFAPRLAPVTLEAGRVLFGAEESLRHVFFVERALLSLLSTLEDGTAVEVGAVGREGVGGIVALLGGGPSALHAVAQVGGEALRVRAQDARAAFRDLPHFRAGVLRYAHLLLTQVSQTAVCNTLHTVEQRLARWLVTCARRLETDRLPLTHEYLSHTLGVRRSGVTVAAGVLEREGLIRHSRGQITVLDPAGLKRSACECAAALVAEYEDFLGG
ncbi:MAG TPA: Crp/Fnr family transcriptional regulator [Pyrinomonadaceae bacterium]|nr:Crp/Fnr family transcriptional regulator [Pyrinomonadaceae bacterium]